ncbi:MAG TPA: nucleotidyltransferase substrate binding protein [Candidatus Saccharimonadales bacterium]|nr:nucleotidyltransferase substrate binding protein [Candidatus Saccharimonadales bacterium]
MKNQDIRWIQRFQNYQKALAQLTRAVDLARQRPLTELERQGMIQAFEYTHELAWNTLKDFLESRGAIHLFGSRDTTRAAFAAGLIQDGELWMQMIQSRNQTTHTYNEEIVEQIVSAVTGGYMTEFDRLQKKLEQLRAEEPTA